MKNVRDGGGGGELKWRKKVVLYLEEAYKSKIKIRSLIASPSVKVSKEESMTLLQSLLFPDELWRRIFLWKKNKVCQAEQQGLTALIAPEKLIIWEKWQENETCKHSFCARSHLCERTQQMNIRQSSDTQG